MSDLEKTSIEEIKQQLTPTEFADYLQAQGEVFYAAKDNIWVVTNYHLAKQVLMSADYTANRFPFFQTRMPNLNPNLIQDFLAVVANMMVMSDGQAHTDRRRICYHGFSTSALNQLIPLIRNIVDQAIKKFYKTGKMEFVSELAQTLPSATLAEFFAIPENERMDFFYWANNMTQFFGSVSEPSNEEGVKVNDSARQLRQYFVDLIKSRRQYPKQDFLSTLLQHQQHFDLSDDEIISQAVMMLVAGQVTTTDQLCNNLYTLLTTEGLWAHLHQHSDELDATIEELNRLDPAVNFIFRVASKNTLIANAHIKASEAVFISTHAVNRDREQFQTPNQINLNNIKQKHMAYGAGAHYCLGAKLARIQMKTCFAALINQFPQCMLDTANAKRHHYSLAFSGFKQLNIKG